MDPRREGQARRLLDWVRCVPNALVLLGCSQMNQAGREQVLAEIPITPRVQIARDEIPLLPEPAAAATGIQDIPQPRMKPPMPRSLRPRAATNLPPAAPKVPAPRPPITASLEPTIAQEPQVPPIVPGELVGSDFSSVREVLREPDYVQMSALTVVWTYSESNCTLRLFFYPDIQTTKFHLLKYDLKSATGERLSDSSLCMQHLVVMKYDESEDP